MSNPAAVIEFITVSKESQHAQKLGRSIALALGSAFAHRLTVVDGNTFDLFRGYNTAASQTRGDILAFVHDDVQFMGNALTFGTPLQMLSDPATGFIGIAGSRLLDTAGTWWADSTNQEQTLKNCRGHLYQLGKNEFGVCSVGWPTHIAGFGQVLVLDGALLLCHRRTFEKLGGFDSESYQGFHFYDVDITFRAALAGLKNYAAPLPLLHESLGKYDQAWEHNRRIFVDRFRQQLPASLEVPAAPTSPAAQQPQSDQQPG